MSQLNFRNRKRSDGSNNWEYYFEIASIDGKRKRISKGGFRTKKEASEEGVRALNKYNNGDHVLTPTEMSFSDFLDSYLDKYCKNELANETVTNYKKMTRLYIKPVLGPYKLKAITPIQINDLLYDMKNKGYSRNTLVCVKAFLSGAFKYAVSPCNYLDHSPMIYVNLPKNYSTKQKQSSGKRSDGKNNGSVLGQNAHVYIEKEYIDKIFARYPESHPSHLPLLLGYKLGTRLGESFALTVEDFDFVNKTVRIDKQVQWNADINKWYIKEPKYGSKRTISVDDELLKIIKRKINQIKKDKFFYQSNYTSYYINDNGVINEEKDGIPINLINVREDGSFVSPRTMQNVSNVIHNNLGYKEFDYHSLRHTHATDLAAAGANPKYVQARLGHKTIKITLEIYQHLESVMERQGADILNKLYG